MDYPRHGAMSKYSFEIANPNSLRNKLFTSLKSILKDHRFSVNCDSLGRFKGERHRLSKADELDEISCVKYAKCDSSTLNYLAPNVTHIDHIVRYCQEHQIKLLLISCPKWHGVVNKLDRGRIDKLLEVAQVYAERYPNVYYKCFLYDTTFTCHPEYFNDVTHMSDLGAERFTPIINEIINKM